MHVIQSKPVLVDADVTGFEWSVADIDALAALIAVIALGQAEHAAQIIFELGVGAPAYTEVDCSATITESGRRQL